MEQTNPNIPATPTPEAPVPAPSPVTPPAAPPVMPPATPSFGEGGSPGSKWYSGVTLNDVMIGGLTVFALCMIIYYYRNKIYYIKREGSQIKKEVEELKINVQTALGPEYKTI